MNIWNRFAGILGVLALGFGLISFLFFRNIADTYTFIHFVVGILLLLFGSLRSARSGRRKRHMS